MKMYSFEKKKSLGETLSTQYMSDVQYVECMLTFFILGWHSKILPVCNRTLAEPPLSLEAEKLQAIKARRLLGTAMHSAFTVIHNHTSVN